MQLTYELFDFNVPSVSSGGYIDKDSFIKTISSQRFMEQMKSHNTVGCYGHMDREKLVRERSSYPPSDVLINTGSAVNYLKDLRVEGSKVLADLVVLSSGKGKELKEMIEKDGFRPNVSMSVDADFKGGKYFISRFNGVDFTNDPALSARLLQVNFSKRVDQFGTPVEGNFEEFSGEEGTGTLKVFSNKLDSVDFSEVKSENEHTDLHGDQGAGESSLTLEGTVEPESTEKTQKNFESEATGNFRKFLPGDKSSETGPLDEPVDVELTETKDSKDFINRISDISDSIITNDEKLDSVKDSFDPPPLPEEDSVDETDFSLLNDGWNPLTTFSRVEYQINEQVNFNLVEYVRLRKRTPLITMQMVIQNIQRYINSKSVKQLNEDKTFILDYLRSFLFQFITDKINDPKVKQINLSLTLGLNRHIKNRRALTNFQLIANQVSKELSMQKSISKPRQLKLVKAQHELFDELLKGILLKVSSKEKREIFVKEDKK